MVIIIYASTSGNTEYVTQVLVEHLGNPKSEIRNPKQPDVVCVRAESAKPEDLLRGDFLILASGTWNKDGIEGYLNPHMDAFFGRANSADLRGRRVALVALGDSRYRYTCRAGERLRRFVLDHGGTLIEPPLLIVDEPYGQEERIKKWGERLLQAVGLTGLGSRSQSPVSSLQSL